jgi:hypothetical protein
MPKSKPYKDIPSDSDLLDNLIDEDSEADTVSLHSYYSDMDGGCLPCEDQASLLKKSALEPCLYDTSSTGDGSAFSNIIETIRNEDKARQKNTRRDIGYSSKNLKALIKELEAADDGADIKAIIRQNLNAAELQASGQSSILTMLWEDIRAELNNNIGFQPHVPGSNKQLLNKPDKTGFFSPKDEDMETNARIADLSHKDKFEYRRMEEKHQETEVKVSALIEEQQSDYSSDDAYRIKW